MYWPTATTKFAFQHPTTRQSRAPQATFKSDPPMLRLTPAQIVGSSSSPVSSAIVVFAMILHRALLVLGLILTLADVQPVPPTSLVETARNGILPLVNAKDARHLLVLVAPMSIACFNTPTLVSAAVIHVP